jgi:hypothetical protein
LQWLFYDSSGRHIGRVDPERRYDAIGHHIGPVAENYIYVGLSRQLGRIEGERLSGSSGRTNRTD